VANLSDYHLSLLRSVQAVGRIDTLPSLAVLTAMLDAIKKKTAA
jgi:hypothetical protein